MARTLDRIAERCQRHASGDRAAVGEVSVTGIPPAGRRVSPCPEHARNVKRTQTVRSQPKFSRLR
jgi:hypothetical protein